ncbi:family 16 glycosylhydrolase [Pseudochryseolinea flava]|uniref:Glycoside hydrolase n=1 Tax=Pseudochryseolinea flava TaxID=2059302 RepID=A0A364Y079_9BACT|nr:family 16 glycosylhydrolase [Pseudochryseolinea flava]RAV99469.1 glycoside hydrolase [Pseudochryseolinea flava]
MNSFKFLFMSALMLIGLTLQAQTWQLEWSDEFTNSIGPAWGFDIGNGTNGWGNNEREYYRRENATIENGQLVITAKRENFGGQNYTSAKLTTGSTGYNWRYGKIEARMRLPAFQGSWPAFWMLGTNIGDPNVGWPKCGEIDIMEQTNTSNTVLGTIHWDNNGYVHYGGNTGTSVTNYHVYAIEWSPSSIKWFVDGVQFHEANILNNINSTNEFHNNFFLILNLAIGGNLPGFTINDAALPAKMYVDYVRVYKATTSPSNPPINSVIWLRGPSNQYVTSANGAGPMYCNRPTVQAWEQFTVVSAGNGKVALRGSNGRYVSSENGVAAMTCNRTTIGGWEQFDWVDAGSGKIALRGSNGQYVSSENGAAAMICNRASIQAWEQFSWGTGVAARSATTTEVVSETSAMSVYPNPSQGSLSIQVHEPSSITIVDSSSGKSVWSSRVKDVAYLTHLRTGTYVVIQKNEYGTHSKRIVVE